ncbi:conserved hypothetical protein [Frankia canadensis]|uniref:Plasmid replication, integration and excision activator n=1 Tax=Frankia canadensis TaxID=1836972 RepID=A0A2I2KY09_9ACTN|nr:plasmid replication, integration and excision activator [Frankia canadensis]SNQ50540.1 conserved hypothetical protein [Frankia canadensis]SOU57830.1 conserved hypothetical protein [Frankia canadensis]
MAVPTRIPVRFEDVFPAGAFVLEVEAASDYDKVKANLSDVQARDKDTGERLWVVRVLDADPAARQAEVKVKITAEVQPVPPDVMPGTPFRPVVFEGLTVTPWVDTSGSRPRQGFALRASAMQAVGTPARRTSAVAA